MRPDVVTFWHGPLDGLRLTCLRSQVAAGHNVTVYSFDPLPGLPDGVGNAEAEAILPHSFAERLRPPERDGSWRDWTILQFSDFFRMRLMAERAGLWLDADVLLLKPIEIDPMLRGIRGPEEVIMKAREILERGPDAERAPG